MIKNLQSMCKYLLRVTRGARRRKLKIDDVVDAICSAYKL